MKWIWSILMATMISLCAWAEEDLGFPFDRTTRITFIRLGDTKSDAGQQFVLQYTAGQWTIERRISRTQETVEKISGERANEILAAFADLYGHWIDHPYFDPEEGGYSLFISIKDSWRMALMVKDRGSEALNNLLDAIEYPEGMVLNPLAQTLPGGVQVSTATNANNVIGDAPATAEAAQ